MGNQDLSKLSDEALMQLASGQKDNSKVISSISDDDLEKIAGAEFKNQIEDAGKVSRGSAFKTGVEQGLTFGFAPAAAGLGAGLGYMSGELERNVKGEGLKDKIMRVVSSFPKAYDEGRKERRDLEETAQKDRPGYNFAGNIGGMALTLPLTAINSAKGAIGLGGLYGTGKAASEADTASQAAADIVNNAALGLGTYGVTKGISAAMPKIKEAVSNASSFVGDKIGNAATKVGSALSGVSEGDIKTYAKYADEIAAMAKSSDNNIAEAADQVRQKFAGSIDNTRKALNSEISAALQSSDKSVEANKIIDAINSQKGKINEKLYPKEIGQIDDIVDKVKSLMSKDGKLSVADAHDIKAFLQDKASSAYRAAGDPASLGTEAAKAAKSGAAIARQLVNEAEPAVASANNKLSELYNIMDGMNKNIITQGKPEAALLAAGSGGNIRNETALKALGQATGVDMLSDAQKLSAMRTFGGSSQLLPVDTTGKSVARMLAGAGAGTVLGGPVGAVVGSALTSPAALKAAIITGKVSKSALDAVFGRPIDMTERGLGEVIKFIGTPQGAAALNQVVLQKVPAGNAISRRLEKISTKQDSE